ncbi:hypothetical protein EDD21DRAFT_422044 [Dissophora ornata]|nr:hypothetical protein EDD21DRAFT_422044 [Dissophora ornata]
MSISESGAVLSRPWMNKIESSGYLFLAAGIGLKIGDFTTLLLHERRASAGKGRLEMQVDKK